MHFMVVQALPQLQSRIQLKQLENLHLKIVAE